MSDIDLGRLFKIRATVARAGELDVEGWWGTEHLLTERGVFVYQRSFPRTHWFAQSNVAGECARRACSSVPLPDGAITLWNLPVDIEAELEHQRSDWLKSPSEWESFFESLEAGVQPGGLLKALADGGFLTEQSAQHIASLAPDDGRSTVAIPRCEDEFGDDTLALLAAGFAHGSQKDLVVPYLEAE